MTDTCPPSPPFDAVCFDCDSTLSRIEGVDELALQAGVEDQIAPLTSAAMDGTLSIDQVYAKRLELVRPDRDGMAWLGNRYVEEMVPGARETVHALHGLGKAVYVVSGGFLPAVKVLASSLSIEDSNVRAVDVYFDDAGAYKGFEEASPLAQPDGKAQVCREIVARHSRVAMIGDGLTDLAARDAGACVIGFGGVANRKVVADGADYFLTKPDLLLTLEILLTDQERVQAGVPRVL